MTFKLGLTGSIGMGKSTTARLFVDEGCALWDADAAVHRLYAKGGDAVGPMSSYFPDAIVEDAVSRDQLKIILQRDPTALRKIEKIVHPLVSQDRANYLASVKSAICVLDIPLLFETGADKHMDAVVCVSVDAETQKQRVMARDTMSETEFETILAKQMPDAEKRKLSDFVVITDTLEHAKKQVQSIVKQIRASLTHA